MSFNYFKPGDFNVLCDVCGLKMKASQLKKRWDGFMVCEADWEPRHEQDFLRAPPGPRPLPWARPEAPDQFIDVTYTTAGVQVTTVPAGTFTPDSEP